MKRFALGVMLVTLVSGSVMADILSRDRAASIIGSLLSNPQFVSIKYPLPVIQWPVAPYFSISGPGCADPLTCVIKAEKEMKIQSINREVEAKMDTLVKVPDSDLARVTRAPKYASPSWKDNPPLTDISVPGTNYTVSISLRWFDEYRKAWKTGLIKGFKWSIRNDTLSAISGIGIVSDDTRPFCQDGYKDGDVCNVSVATRKLKSVTGIRNRSTIIQPDSASRGSCSSIPFI